MPPDLTILNNSIPPKKRRLLKGARFLKRLLLGKRPLIDQHEGHSAVTRSVLEGLKSINASFNYNPATLDEIGPTLLVLSNLKALSQAIDLKKRGLIKRLYAGPMFDIDSNKKHLLDSPEIDYFIVNSGFTYDWCIKEIPELLGKCLIWPAGVNMNEWTPKNSTKKKKQVLIYDKLEHGQPIQEYRKFLKEKGWDSSIIRYGYYTKEKFLKALQESQLAIFFSVSESQGIALLESWSTNVPTLVWNRGWAAASRGRKPPASSAPYLNDKLGCFFSDFNDFKNVFHTWEQQCSNSTPRKWVFEHMSDEICARNLLKLIRLNK